MRNIVLAVALLCSLLMQGQTFSAKFNNDTLRVKEIAGDTTYLVGISLKDATATAVVVTITDGQGSMEQTATKADYDFITPVQLTFTDKSPLQMSLPLIIKKDANEDQNELIKLILSYSVTGDTKPRGDTLYIVILDDSKTVKEEVKPDQTISISKSVTLNNTAYQSVINEVNKGFILRSCKLRENNPWASIVPDGDSCKSFPLDAEISRSIFRSVFISQYVALGVDEKTHAEYLNAQADALFDKWKAKMAEPGIKESETKAAKEMKEAAQEIKSALDKIMQSRKDTGLAELKAALGNVPVYTRVLPNGERQQQKQGQKEEQQQPAKIQDPIGDTSNTYYYPEWNATVGIDSMSIRFQDGFITNVIIFPSDSSRKKYGLNKVTVVRKYFDMRSSVESAENLNAYLPLESYHRNYRSKRFSYARTAEPPRIIRYHRLFINLYDILKYNPKIDSLGDILLNVKNRNLSFSKNLNTIIKLTDKDLNSFAQLNIYTDIVGFTEDKPNGLIQLEGKFETGIFSQPLFNNNYYSRVKLRLLPSASLSFNWRKIENKLKYLIVPKDSVLLFNSSSQEWDSIAKDKKYVTSIQLLQYASLDVSSRFNLINIESDYTGLNVYAGFGILRTPINDTTHGLDTDGKEIISDNRTTVNSLKLYYGLRAKFKSTSRLGLELGLEYIRLRFNNSSILQTYNEYDDLDRKNIVKETRLRLFSPQVFAPNGHFYYYLDREQQNRIYARTQYFMNIKSRTDDFFFLQIGYSTDISGLFRMLGGEK